MAEIASVHGYIMPVKHKYTNTPELLQEESDDSYLFIIQIFTNCAPATQGEVSRAIRNSAYQNCMMNSTRLLSEPRDNLWRKRYLLVSTPRKLMLSSGAISFDVRLSLR